MTAGEPSQDHACQEAQVHRPISRVELFRTTGRLAERGAASAA